MRGLIHWCSLLLSIVQPYTPVRDVIATATTASKPELKAWRDSGSNLRPFMHSTGHGLGLEIHEPPRLGKRDKARLQAGMAITIEPGVYLEGFGGIRIEDTVVVTGGRKSWTACAKSKLAVANGLRLSLVLPSCARA